MQPSTAIPKALALTGTLAAIFVVYAVGVRPWYLRWGATDREVTQTLPGDTVVPTGSETTRAITIHARPEAVWPWIAQLGQDRGGFYSYELLEDLAGTQMENASRILPDKQTWNPGDKLWMYPPGIADEIAGAPLVLQEPGHALVFATRQIGTPLQAPHDGTWAFVLEPLSDGNSRFLVRGRAAGGLNWLASAFAHGVFEPVHFVMERKMLEGIKARAEGTKISETLDVFQVLLWAATFALFVTALVLVIRREHWASALVALAASACVFQCLTFLQPSPILGWLLVSALASGPLRWMLRTPACHLERG